jgi:hypothetical protein
VNAVVRASVVLPEDLSYRILELAALFEASIDRTRKNEPDWESYDLLDEMAVRYCTEIPGFQEALDKAVLSEPNPGFDKFI